ncbi:MAG: TIGR02391 family protein [bacterium]|nr:TIGR02391 family protein [bacterium]
MPKQHPPISGGILEGIAKILAHTDYGLTGTELSKFISEARLIDTDPSMTKWKRLYNSFVEFQNRKGVSNNIYTFIMITMNPGRFIGKNDEYEHLRNELNKRLSLIGIELKTNGKLSKVKSAKTISEAEQRVNRFKEKLKQRNAHEKIFEFCNEQLVTENYFHSVFEATKSIAETIRSKTMLTTDGTSLIDTAFSISSPLIQINDLSTETKQSEHKGFANLIRGVFGMFRNTTAHAPSIVWPISEEDALDILSTISLIHRKLELSENF